jgi:hypothetical protein
MRLHRVVITGYRSIRSETQLHLEPDVTVVLGPNDHGKTNCLSALLHLNKDAPFVEDVDLNWDSSDRADAMPSVAAYFTLTADEIARVIATENPLNEKPNQKVLAARAAQKEQDTEQPEEPNRGGAEKHEGPGKPRMRCMSWSHQDNSQGR